VRLRINWFDDREEFDDVEMADRPIVDYLDMMSVTLEEGNRIMGIEPELPIRDRSFNSILARYVVWVDETNQDRKIFYDSQDKDDQYIVRKRDIGPDSSNIQSLISDYGEEKSIIIFKSLGKEEERLFRYIDSIHEEAKAVWELSTGED
jgi:hypothetical protein